MLTDGPGGLQCLRLRHPFRCGRSHSAEIDRWSDAAPDHLLGRCGLRHAMAAFRREVFPQTMSEKPKPVYLPPFSEVRLVECRDHFQLVAVPKCRVVFGYGRIQSRHAVIDPEDPDSEPIWCDLKPDEEVWAVMQWYEFDDGHREKGSVSYLHPEVPAPRSAEADGQNGGIRWAVEREVAGTVVMLRGHRGGSRLHRQQMPQLPDRARTEFHGRIRRLPRTLEGLVGAATQDGGTHQARRHHA